MKKFVFEGNSDDTFGEYNEIKDDYDNCASGEPIQYKIQTNTEEGIMVTGLFGGKHGMGNGCWMIGVESLNEDKPVEWEIKVYPSNGGYRNRLTVLAPEDATCRLHSPKREG